MTMLQSWPIRIFSLCAGLFAFVILGVIVHQEIQFVRGGIRAEAEIVSVEIQAAGFDHDDSTGTTPIYVHRIVYRYEADDSVHRGEATENRTHYKGQRIPIQYLASEPARSRLADEWSGWSWVIVSSFVGLLGVLYFLFPQEFLGKAPND